MQFDITEDSKFFIGEDKIINFSLVDASGIPIDLTGMELDWNVRKTDASGGDPLIQKTPQIVGTYNVDPAVNTQRARITLTPDDTIDLKAATYRHSLKRLDVNSESILSYGDFTLLIATEH